MVAQARTSRLVLGLVGLFALLGVGCRGCTQKVEVPKDTPPHWTAPEDAVRIVIRSLDPERGCDPTALLPAGQGRTRARALFSRIPGSRRQSRYCVVDPVPGQRAIAASVLAAFTELAKSVGYEATPDYYVVLSAGPLQTLPRPEARTTYLERAGAPSAATWPAQTDPTRIALIDTVEPGNVAPGWSVAAMPSEDHGVLLARLMEELVCPAGAPASGACLAQVRPYLALGSSSPQGPVGAVSDLAEAIIRAVDDAKDEEVAHLVINLSLGWVPVSELGGAKFEDLPGPAAAVADALRYAACRGAITFAAAGNNLGGPAGAFDDGLVYPAGWQAPTSVDCAEYTGDEFKFEGSIVHAVGGLGAADRRIALTRPGSLPTLAAYADDGVASAVAGAPGPGEYTAPLSGTSLGTAVVSAAAAARWTLQTALSNVTLADEVRDPAGTSPDPADVDYKGSTTVAVVRVCDQVNAACTAVGCPGVNWTCPGMTTPGPSAGTFTQLRDGMTVKAISGLTTATCTNGPVLGAPGFTTCLDGFVTSIDETPWVHPQPGCDPCSPCLVQTLGSGKVGFLFEGGDPCMTWQNAWLVFEGFSPGQRQFIDIKGILDKEGLGGVAGTTGIVFDDLPVPAGMAGGYRAKLVVAGTSGGTVMTVASELPIR